MLAQVAVSFCLVLLFSSALFGHSATDAASGKYTPEALADQVKSLPGWGALNGFRIFSGYVTVDESAGRALFYTYVESERSPDEDPLVFWSNGGPGCSSIGGGFLSELGPFLPLPGGKKLQKNPFAWNKIANTLFVDSPAFVGFSYSNSSRDAVVGDERTAQDSRAFLLGFFDKFPHARSKELYLSGESYAGHYVPNLALEIVKGNKAADKDADSDGYINLKGFLLGNPLTDTAIDNHGAIDFWWHHAIISDQTWQGMKDNCDFNTVGPLKSSAADILCEEFVARSQSEMGPINIYEIFADTCLPMRARKEMEQMASVLKGYTHLPLSAALQIATHKPIPSRATEVASDHVATARKLLFAAGDHALKLGAREEEPAYDPCVDDEVGTYLNLPEVQRALHANQTVPQGGPWSDCTGRIIYSRKDLLASMLPVYEQLLKAPGPLRMVIYSGDVDGILPVVGTRNWVSGLGRDETESWRPWYSESQQVGGYTVGYDGIRLVTIRNAGHMVPYVQPERMFHVMEKYLSGEPL